MKYWKNVLLFILIVIIMQFVLCSCSSVPEKVKLSEMDDEELLQYVSDSGVTIPDAVTVEVVRKTVIKFEDDPESPIPVMSWTVATDFYEGIREVVADYYVVDS